MGIPAYFRWVSEKYPKILSQCVEHASYDECTGTFMPVDCTTPNPNGVEFDNLYLDMNGIIHPCTHPEDRPAPTTEAAMFEAIFDYIDRLFAIVRPRKLLYLAIDGVAPRAKINQQRSRRFRSAREAQEKAAIAEQLREDWKRIGLQVDNGDDQQKAKAKNGNKEEKIEPATQNKRKRDNKKKNKASKKDNNQSDQQDANNTSTAGGTDDASYLDITQDIHADPGHISFDEHPFDSNVITPGTPFMARLAKALRGFVANKMATCPSWKNLIVLLSDASVPGEGEHKIAEFIRRERAQPGYNPNLKHVMYGLDADLIMLALATHEVHFTILREEVVFGRRPPGGNATAAASAPVRQANTALAPTDQSGIGAATAALSLQSALGGRKPFIFLHIHILREYLDHEFRHDMQNEIDTARKLAARQRTTCLASQLEYDLERVLDDFVCLCFFVGNDFLPHLPTLDIREGAIGFLMELYKSEFVNTGYLTSPGGDIDFAAVKRLLYQTGIREDEIFKQRGERERQHRMQDLANQNQAFVVPDDVVEEEKPGKSTDKKKKKRASKDKKTGTDTEKKVSVRDFTVELGSGPKSDGKVGSSKTRAANSAALNSSFRNRTRSAASQGSKVDNKKGSPSSSGKKPNPVLEVSDDDEEDKDGDYQAEDVEGSNEEDDEEDDDDDVKQNVVVKSKDEFETALKEMIRKKNEVKMEDTIKLGEAGWKDRYYQSKFGWDLRDLASGDEKQVVVRKYVEGLHWVMKYYYVGCISWGWFYPFHYAPFASDLVECPIDRAADIHLDLGRPFDPFSQLQAVMPACSGRLVLPTSYADLMSDNASPIIDYYPADFEVDLNGKRFAWQGVVLLPFIDETRLEAALAPLRSKLSPAERVRNAFGHCQAIAHVDTKLGAYFAGTVAKFGSGREAYKKSLAIPQKTAEGLLFGRVQKSTPLSQLTAAVTLMLADDVEEGAGDEEDADAGSGSGSGSDSGSVKKKRKRRKIDEKKYAAATTGSSTAKGTSSSDASVIIDGDDGKAVAIQFELPEMRAHESKLLPQAVLPGSCLSDYDKAESRRGGWKQAKFGPLGKVALALMNDRTARVSRAGGGGKHGRGGSGAYYNGRGGGGHHYNSGGGGRGGYGCGYSATYDMGGAGGSGGYHGYNNGGYAGGRGGRGRGGRGGHGYGGGGGGGDYGGGWNHHQQHYQQQQQYQYQYHQGSHAYGHAAAQQQQQYGGDAYGYAGGYDQYAYQQQQHGNDGAYGHSRGGGRSTGWNSNSRQGQQQQQQRSGGLSGPTVQSMRQMNPSSDSGGDGGGGGNKAQRGGGWRGGSGSGSGAANRSRGRAHTGGGGARRR